MPSSLVVGEAILTIAVILAASMVSAAFLPSFQLLIQSEKVKVKRMVQRSETAVEIVFANAINGTSRVKVWVKNVGSRSIPQTLIGCSSDLFFAKIGEKAERIPYEAENPPSWSYRILNDDGNKQWDPHETIEITISLNETLGQGDYLVKFSAYTGEGTAYTFSL